VIGVATIAVTVGAGALMTVADRHTFPSIGSGLWWAIQTSTTVGYGDNVPVSVAGRLIAALVMLFGIGFLTVITAAITSTFVSRSRLDSGSETAAAGAEQFRHLDERLERIEAAVSGSSGLEPTVSGAEDPTAEQFREIDGRLERIEAALTRPS
jgi:voltage-gated potassium channel